jgi:hypothetical protein
MHGLRRQVMEMVIPRHCFTLPEYGSSAKHIAVQASSMSCRAMRFTGHIDNYFENNILDFIN